MVEPEVQKSGGWRRQKAGRVRRVKGVVRREKGCWRSSGTPGKSEKYLNNSDGDRSSEEFQARRGACERWDVRVQRENSERTMTEVSKKDQNIPKGTRYPKKDQKPSVDVQIETGKNQLRDQWKAGTEVGIAAQLCAHQKHCKSGTEKSCPPTMRSADQVGGDRVSRNQDERRVGQKTI
ncbi:hypothetical protein B0H10DRAFT_1940002 [Mycena sp. CBHHK59/15]|nr:hypothetical protein B0H10DRAFT_1940002 [Mycena sp. CBHHK59/15]